MTFRRQIDWQQIHIELEDKEKMFVCQEICLRDPMLKQLNGKLRKNRVCGACGGLTSNALTPERIGRFIRNHLPAHFSIDNGLFPNYEMSLVNVVSHAIGCSNDMVCSAIAEWLVDPDANEDDFYLPGQEYCVKASPFESEEHERWYLVGSWNKIANVLTHGSRFFNDEARRFFDSLIFEALTATPADHPEIRAVVREVSVDSSFYRARIASGLHEAGQFKENPTDALGAPPKERAANNRMSPAGTPLLYVSSNAQTCIAEVRPSMGDFVVVGRFTSTAPLKLFDFTALSKRLAHTPLSYFDPQYEKRVEHRRLLAYLHDEIARPVGAHDIDYVVTQALAEFIRYGTAEGFDGIAFRSVQCAQGVNFVLFDRGMPESINEPNWRPKFDLDICSDAVTIHRIDAVHYDSTEEQSFKDVQRTQAAN